MASVENIGSGVATAARFQTDVDPDTQLVNGTVTTTAGTVLTGNRDGDLLVEVDLGDITPFAPVAVTFDVVIKDDFPAAREEIACQGEVLAQSVGFLPSDDPDTPEPDDPTVTPIVALPSIPIHEIPTLATTGLVGLGLLLTLSALQVLRRRRLPTSD